VAEAIYRSQASGAQESGSPGGQEQGPPPGDVVDAEVVDAGDSRGRN